MKKALFALLALLVLFAPSAFAEEDAMVRDIEEQLKEKIEDFEKRYDFKVAYELEPKNISGIQLVFGFVTKAQSFFEEDKETRWKRKLRDIDGVNLFITNKDVEKRGHYWFIEKTTNRHIDYNPMLADFNGLIRKLVRDKEIYNEIQDQLRKMRVEIRMADDMAWSDASVFVRSLDKLMDENRSFKRIVKRFTLLVEREAKRLPDYENKVIPVAYQLSKEELVHKMETSQEEFDAYEDAKPKLEKLKEKGIDVHLHESLTKNYFERLWREVDPVLDLLLKLAREDKVMVTLTNNKIILVQMETKLSGEGLELSIYDDIEVTEAFIRRQ